MPRALLVFALIVLSPRGGQAHEQLGVGSIEALAKLVGRVDQTTMVKVKGAQLAYVNHAALRRDFPHLRQWSNRRIERWILDNFAYVSVMQLLLDGIRQTPIPVDFSDVKTGHRPPEYERATLLGDKEREVATDNKGDGRHETEVKITPALVPRKQIKRFWQAVYQGDEKTVAAIRRHRSDGMMSFAKANAEIFRETAVRMLFDLHNAKTGENRQTVETYYIIHVPAHRLVDGKKVPLAIYGRQTNIGRADADRTVPKEIYTDPTGFCQASYSRAALDWGAAVINDPRLASLFSSDQHERADQRIIDAGSEAAQSFLSGDRMAVHKRLERILAPIKGDWGRLPVAAFLRKFSQPIVDPRLYRQLVGNQEPGLHEYLERLTRSDDPVAVSFARLAIAHLVTNPRAPSAGLMAFANRLDEKPPITSKAAILTRLEQAETDFRRAQGSLDKGNALQPIQRIDITRQSKPIQDRFFALLQQAFDLGDGYVDMHATSALIRASNQRGLRLIRRYIDDTRASRRWEMAIALGSHRCAASAALLERLLADPDPQVQRYARKALVDHRTDSAAKRLIEKIIYRPESDKKLVGDLVVKIVSRPATFGQLIRKVVHDPAYPENAVKRTCRRSLELYKANNTRRLRRYLRKFL